MGFAAAERLRALMAAGAGRMPVLAPGVWDGLSARLAIHAGAAALHASGGAIARAAGQPDLGILGLAEMEARIGEIVEGAGGAPVIADADTGYGGLLNLAHAVRRYARLGFAILIYPGDAQRAAIAAMDAAFRAVLRDGDGRSMADRMAPAALRDGVVGTAALMQAEARWTEGDQA
jgi:2-methylisocitrate lyase-like PEP mutase family enzyme